MSWIVLHRGEHLTHFRTPNWRERKRTATARPSAGPVVWVLEGKCYGPAGIRTRVRGSGGLCDVQAILRALTRRPKGLRFGRFWPLSWPPSQRPQRAELPSSRTPDVRSWYNDHAKVGTAVTQLDQLELFLRRTHLELEELVALAKKPPAKRLKEVVNSYVRTEQAAGRRARYVLNVWWGVRSFLASQEAAPEWNPTVEKTEADEDDAARTVPSHEQLRQVASAVKSGRDRAVVYLLASSGIRIGVLATQHPPADGLRLKHLPELEYVREPKFGKVPFAIRVPAHLSKGKNAVLHLRLARGGGRGPLLS